MERRTEEAAADIVLPKPSPAGTVLPKVPQADGAVMQKAIVTEPLPVESTAALPEEEPVEETAAMPPEPEVLQEMPPEPQRASLPSEEMQRLMSTAGQSLRAVDTEVR